MLIQAPPATLAAAKTEVGRKPNPWPWEIDLVEHSQFDADIIDLFAVQESAGPLYNLKRKEFATLREGVNGWDVTARGRSLKDGSYESTGHNLVRFTIEAYIHCDTSGLGYNVRAPIVGMAEAYGSGTKDRELYIDDNGNPRFYIFDGGARHVVDTSTTIAVGGFYHIIATADGSNIRIWTNNNAGASTPAGNAFQFGSPILQIHRGMPGFNFQRSFNHLLLLAYYDRALSEQEVRKRFEKSFGLITPSLPKFWPAR